MPSDRVDQLHIEEMLEAGERIGGYLNGWTFDDFISDLRTFDAVCMNLIRIGEGAKHLTAETRDALPYVPWPDIRSLRNKVAHSYAQLRVDAIWRIATLSVPELAQGLRVLAEE